VDSKNLDILKELLVRKPKSGNIVPQKESPERIRRR
jgi:hypothetical protein